MIMQFSTEQQITEIRIPNCAAAIESLRIEWDKLFDSWTEESFEDFFDGSMYDRIVSYFERRDCDTQHDWDGDDLTLEVKDVYNDEIDHFQEKLTEISNCLPLLDVGKFCLDTENDYPNISCYDSDDNWIGSVRFIMNDSEDEDESKQVAMRPSHQGNDFVDIFDSQPAVTLAPVTEPTNSEEAALAALKWLGEKFGVPTHDER